jgi:hypothetical protein
MALEVHFPSLVVNFGAALRDTDAGVDSPDGAEAGHSGEDCVGVWSCVVADVGIREQDWA